MKIDFSKPIGIARKDAQEFRAESEKIINDFIKQVHTNPIVNKWWKEQLEKFKLEMINNSRYYTEY